MSKQFLTQLLAVAMLASAVGLTARAEERQSTKPSENANFNPRRLDPQLDAIDIWDEKNSFPKNAVLFVGDSDIYDWLTTRAFPKLPVINRGLKGGTIADINYFDEGMLGKYKPRVIVLHAGEIEIAAGKSPKDVLGDLQVLMGYVQVRLPKTKVIFLPVVPCPARAKISGQAQDFNKLVKELSEKNTQLVYVDTATPFFDQHGKPSTEFFIPNGQHINYKGWEIWSKTLTPILKSELEKN